MNQTSAMEDTIFVIIQIQNNIVATKAYSSLRRLCKEHGFEHDKIKGNLPFKHKDKYVVETKLDGRV